MDIITKGSFLPDQAAWKALAIAEETTHDSPLEERLTHLQEMIDSGALYSVGTNLVAASAWVDVLNEKETSFLPNPNDHLAKIANFSIFGGHVTVAASVNISNSLVRDSKVQGYSSVKASNVDNSKIIASRIYQEDLQSETIVEDDRDFLKSE